MFYCLGAISNIFNQLLRFFGCSNDNKDKAINWGYCRLQNYFLKWDNPLYVLAKYHEDYRVHCYKNLSQFTWDWFHLILCTSLYIILTVLLAFCGSFLAIYALGAVDIWHSSLNKWGRSNAAPGTKGKEKQSHRSVQSHSIFVS